LAQAAEITDERQRIEPVPQHIRSESKRDMPRVARHGFAVAAFHFWFVSRQRQPRLWLGRRAQAGIQAVEEACARLADSLERRFLVACDEAVEKRRHVVAALEQPGDERAVDRKLARTDELMHAL